MADASVAIEGGEPCAEYPTCVPFLPDAQYSELTGRVSAGTEANHPYRLIRASFAGLGLDRQRQGTPEWNPLGDLIRPGNRVVVKPNLVRHLHMSGGDYRAVVTHPSVVRCVLDFAAKALEGRGEITVGDAPVQSADFSEIVRRNHLTEVCADVSSRWGVTVRLVDFRLWSLPAAETHCLGSGTNLPGDPEGYARVALGAGSLLHPLRESAGRFRVTSYDCSEMSSHHREDVHEYIVARSILNADVVLNLPKLKTHRKVGLTGGLKNCVGVNGHKDWLPHHRSGSVSEGGDEYLNRSVWKSALTCVTEALDRAQTAPAKWFGVHAASALHRAALAWSKDAFLEGSWYGNDTLWRTVLDLNRLLIYADVNGVMQREPQRAVLTVVDGILAGEGEGPMEPDARRCGWVLVAFNAAAVDAVAATLMGFNFRKIPVVANAFVVAQWPLVGFAADEISIICSEPSLMGIRPGRHAGTRPFRAPSGWAGHVEFK